MGVFLNKINNNSDSISNEDIASFVNGEISKRDLSLYFGGVNIQEMVLSVKEQKDIGKWQLNVDFATLKKSIEDRLFSLPSFKVIYEKQFIFKRSKFINNVVAIICLFLLFHELEHIEHVRTKNTEVGFEANLHKDISKMLDINPYYLSIGQRYFVDEIMADVEALHQVETLEKNSVLKISKAEKTLFNQFVAERLYSAYTVENEIYAVDLGEHPAPMDYMAYLAKTRLHMENDLSFIQYANSLDYSLNDIKFGKRIDSSVVEYLRQLRMGEAHSLDLRSDIEKVLLNTKSISANKNVYG